jgi:ABC-type oligopeptide transport system substrate-binding subunit
MLAAGVALLAAATLAGPASGTGTRMGGTLRIGMPRDFDYLDPALAHDGPSFQLLNATCAKLFNFPDKAGAAGLRLRPEVAARYPTISKDGRTYTFELKQTFRFETGAPVTAQSFADAFNRNANPRMKSPWASSMQPIVGVKAVEEGRASALVGVKVLGLYRLRIQLTRPVGDFLSRLTLPAFCPILPKTPVDPDGITPAGSGPYYVHEWVRNRRAVARRNPYYRGSRPAHVDEIVWSFPVEPEPCRRAVEADQTDFCWHVWPDAVYADLERKHGLNRRDGRFFRKQLVSTWSFAFNQTRPAFKGAGQIPLKKAINYALDRPALIRAPGRYLRPKRTDQLLPPPIGRDVAIYPLKGADYAQAKKWLARAKHKPDKLVLYWLNAGAPLAQVFVYNLAQIGIDVEVEYFGPEALAEKLNTPGEPFDVYWEAWGWDYPDGAAFFVPLHGKWSMEHPGYKRAIDAADRKRGEARAKAWADLDIELMRNDPPRAPYLHRMGLTFISASFGCYVHHPVYNTIDLVAACKK